MELNDLCFSSYGLVRGRDAINIVELNSRNPNRIEITVSVYTNSLEKKNGLTTTFVHFKLDFTGVIMYRVFNENIRGLLGQEELEMFIQSDAESVFMEIKNSKLVESNIGVLQQGDLRHLILETYDYRVETICQDFGIVKL